MREAFPYPSWTGDKTPATAVTPCWARASRAASSIAIWIRVGGLKLPQHINTYKTNFWGSS